jgi:hypothetical protein
MTVNCRKPDFESSGISCCTDAFSYHQKYSSIRIAGCETSTARRTPPRNVKNLNLTPKLGIGYLPEIVDGIPSAKADTHEVLHNLPIWFATALTSSLSPKVPQSIKSSVRHVQRFAGIVISMIRTLSPRNLPYTRVSCVGTVRVGVLEKVQVGAEPKQITPAS